MKQIIFILTLILLAGTSQAIIDSQQIEISKANYQKSNFPGADVFSFQIKNGNDEIISKDQYKIFFTGNGFGLDIGDQSYRGDNLESDIGAGETKTITILGTGNAPVFDSKKHCETEILVGLVKKSNFVGVSPVSDILVQKKLILDCNEDKVVLHSLNLRGDNLEVVYSKNFDTCTHLLTESSSIVHKQNFFCQSGEYKAINVNVNDINVLPGKKYKLCHGNNYNICSELLTLEQTKNKRIILWTDKSSYNKGEKFQLTAKVVDEDGTPFTPDEGAQVVVYLIQPSGKSDRSDIRYNSANGYYEISEIIPQNEESGVWNAYATVSIKATSQIVATSEKINFKIAETETRSEQVGCSFKGSTSEQKCYSDDGRFGCQGREFCAMKVSGSYGEKITWKSTCGGYAYTKIDGDDETAEFSCQATTKSCPEGCSCYDGKVFECAIDKAPCPTDCKCDTHGVVLYCGKQQCVDSDGGKNYYEKGFVRAPLAGKIPDICAAVGKSPEKADYYKNLLHEAYCYDESHYGYEDYYCPNGCEDGACVPFIKDADELKRGDENEDDSSKGCPQRKCEGISKCLNNHWVVIEECTYYIKSNNKCNEIKNSRIINMKEVCNADDNDKIVAFCQGCQLDESTCIPFGTRLEKKDSVYYCDITKKMALQKENKASCQNSYECLSNNCKSGSCTPICEGCLNEEKVCIPIGTRTGTSYCDSDYSFKAQNPEDGKCSNNYECSSNLCVNNRCISPSLMQKIIDWFKKLFG